MSSPTDSASEPTVAPTETDAGVEDPQVSPQMQQASEEAARASASVTDILDRLSQRARDQRRAEEEKDNPDAK